MARALLLLVATCAATSGSIAVADGPGARVRTAKAQSRRRTERTQRRGPRTSAYLALTANTSRRLVVLDHWKGHGIGQQLMVCTMPCTRHSHRFPANPVSSPIVALPALTHHRSPLAPHTRGGGSWSTDAVLLSLWQGSALWMALAQYTDRALRFAACVPRHLQSKFNVFMKDNLGLAMPPCDQAGIFDLHEHFTFRGLGDLRASATDLEDALVLDVNRPAASFWPRNKTQWARNHRNCHAHEPCRSEVAGRLEHALFGPRRSTSRVLAVVMMHLRIADRILVRPWLSDGITINGDGRMMNHREWESCLRDLRPLRGWQVPPCDVGLHVRTLAVDDARCNVFSVEDSSNPCPSHLAGRLRDNKKGKLPWPSTASTAALGRTAS